MTTENVTAQEQDMINFSHGSTTMAILLLATTAYGQCEYTNYIPTYDYTLACIQCTSVHTGVVLLY